MSNNLPECTLVFRRNVDHNLTMVPHDLNNWRIFALLKPEFISQINAVFVFGDSGKEALIITKNRTVYAMGKNSYGCLGIGNEESTLHLKEVEAFLNKNIKTFAWGNGPHVLAVTDNGQVYSWGSNSYGELGNGSTRASSNPTILGSSLKKQYIVDVACGRHHCLALTALGEVYAWGKVGTNAEVTILEPRKVNIALQGQRIICISCGDSSSIAVTSIGKVYSWGCNGVGQLGIGNFVDQVEPCSVKALAGVVIEKVVSGRTHTLALSDEGVLYAWGANSYGELGLNTTINVATPTKLEVPEMGRVLDIAASHCNNISVAMDKDNQIFVWGHCLGQIVKVPMLTQLTRLLDAFACYALSSVTPYLLVPQNNRETNLVNSISKAFNDPATSDLVIEVHGNAIYVHKAILKIRCHYFRTMFQDHWIENSKSIIELDQFSYDTYNTFFKYLYTNEIDLSVENALELLELANSYSENHLERRCIQVIKKGITVGNVIFFYSTSIAYNIKELEEYCFRFAMNNMTAAMQTENFLQLDESTAKSFIIKAAKAGAFKT